MSLAEKLAEERRARLAAERLLELKQAELFAANRQLGQHARKLSEEIVETRAEVATVRDENQRVKSELGAANEKIEVVESQLWMALESIHDGFAMYNADRCLVLANPAWMSVFDGLDTIAPGASQAHILDMMVEEGIVDLQGEPGDLWRARMLNRWDQTPIPEETLRLWSGHFIKIEDRRTPDGGIVSLAVDITGLMRMWSAVEELPDGFVMYDSDDRLLMCNQRYRDFYAASAPAMVRGASFEDILRYGLTRGQYPEAVGREDAWLEERMEHHRAARTELEQPLSDGRWLRVLERETREGGRVGLRVDITHLKDTQAQLDEARKRAEAANRAKSAFLANMSHELRTPMNGVVGMADLLAETELTEDQRLNVDTIRTSGEALLTIINDLLDFSKIEADRLTLRPESFDLEDLVTEIVLLLQVGAREKRLELLVDYDLFLPTRFVGDRGRLRQVLINLIGNAVKFTREGHVLVRITGAEAGPGQTALHVAVEDTGIGIPPDKLDHIFGEFNQVEDERNRQFEGTGLGLAISRRIIALMGGELWAESQPDSGSCFAFRIVLPTEASEPAERRPLPAGLRRVALAGEAGPQRAILERQLARLGLTVVSLADGGADLVVLWRPSGGAAEPLAALRASGHAGPVLVAHGRADALPDLQDCGPGVRALPVPAQLGPLVDALCGVMPEDRPGAPPPVPGPGDGLLDVLVAEDNRTNRLVFSKMVKDLPLSLRFAEDGEQAVARHAERRPDIVFMDISMPRMDGKEATRHIRAAEGGGPRVPIIAVTAHAMDGDREAILEAGLDGYLTKPVRKAALRALLAEHFPARDWSGDQTAGASARTKTGLSGSDISGRKA